MKKTTGRAVMVLLSLFAAAIAFGAQGVKKPVAAISWGRCLSAKPDFYAGDEAVRIADNVLMHQRSTGGWPKSIDVTRILSERDKAGLSKVKNKELSLV